MGSVDANTGDLLLGWDTDQFPTDVYLTTKVMLLFLKYGGFTTGGVNFDAKVRRESFEPIDLFYAHVGGMDTFAKGLKIAAAIRNAQAFLAVQKEFGSFDRYIWSFVGGRPIVHALRSLKEMPATSPESDALSRDLKAHGFKFVGSTICYAFMQAAGLINDHTVGCFRQRQVGRR